MCKLHTSNNRIRSIWLKLPNVTSFHKDGGYEKLNHNKMLAVFWQATFSVLIDTCHRFGRTCGLRFQDKSVSRPRYPLYFPSKVSDQRDSVHCEGSRPEINPRDPDSHDGICSGSGLWPTTRNSTRLSSKRTHCPVQLKLAELSVETEWRAMKQTFKAPRPPHWGAKETCNKI